MLPSPWNLRNQPAKAAIRITLYTRAGCHLCDDAKSYLENEARHAPLLIETIDIDHHPELYQDYSECVPVVFVNDQLRFRGRIDPLLWRRLLRALMNGTAEH